MPHRTEDLHGRTLFLLSNREPYEHVHADDGSITLNKPAGGLVSAEAVVGVWALALVVGSGLNLGIDWDRYYLPTTAVGLVLAGVAETRADREGIEAAVGEPVLLCRLRVEPAVLQARLVDRHQHDPEGLRWHLDRAPEPDRILDAAALEDVAVDATNASVVEVARDVLATTGWASH